MSKSYIDVCRRTLAAIDPENIAQRTPERPEETMNQGSFAIFHPLGAIMLQGEEVYVGVKTQRSHEHSSLYTFAKQRVAAEIGVAGLYYDHSPELRGLLPQFMGTIRVEGAEWGAIITEDASRNGQYDVVSTEVSRKTQELLYAPFQERGERGDVLDDEVVRGSLAFRCGADERLLDFTPSPIQPEVINTRDGDDRFSGYARDARTALRNDELTITIPQDTPLGLLLARDFNTL